MSSPLLESLAEERVAKLETISRTRNDLLRQMYHLMRRRDNLGLMLSEEEEEEDDIQAFLEKHDLYKNPETGPFSILPQSELFAPPVVPPRPSTPRIADQTPRTLRSSSRDKPLSASSAKSPALDSPSSPSTRATSKKPPSRRGKSQLIDLTESQEETVMDVDEVALPASVSKRMQKSQDEEPESDDILRLLPSDSRPSSSRAKSASLPPALHSEDDDEPDELDLLGSLTTPRRPSPSVSNEPRARSMTRQLSSTPSEGSQVLESSEAMIVDSKEEVTKVDPGDGLEDTEKTEQELLDEWVLVEDDEEIAAEEELVIEEKQASVSDEAMELLEAEVQSEPGLTPAVPVDEELTPVEDTDQIMLSEPTPPFSDTMPARPYIPVIAANMPPRGRPLTIPTPSSPMPQPLPFDFDVDVDIEPEAERTIAPAQTVHHFDPQYALPPLKTLPIEFNRKGKLSKQQRKREKEREKFERGAEKAEGKKDMKEDWVPVGMNRWGALLRANPVWRRVSRATKCLSTRDWSVAITELRLIRTLERIELLKDGGRWSLRQPKKQRAVGGLVKTHWDHVMDEMKWMRIDFREERKWKMALAYNLGTAVLEWHAAGSLSERVRLGISVLWKRPHIDENETGDAQPEPNESQMEVDNNTPMQSRSNPLSLIDYGSDDDDEQEKDQQSVIDALDTAAMIEEALDSADTQNADQGAVEPKVEDVEDSLALQSDAINEGANLMDVDVPEGSQETEAAKRKKEEEDSSLSALKSSSTDPILAINSAIDGEPSASPPTSRPSLKANVYAPLREKIAYSDDSKLFLDLDDLILSHNFSALSTNDTSNEDPPPAPDLSAIFPDLQPLALLDVPTPIATSSSSEGRRRSERKDKDDPNKRAEDTTYSKLTSIGQFMRCKPTLLGPLQPSKRWKNGQWSNVDEMPVIVDYESPLTRMVDDTSSDLFDQSKPINIQSTHAPGLPMPPKDAHRRASDQVWTSSEDLLLKNLAERYPNNWLLISDSFNSSRVTISTDKRTPWDCRERWSVRWGPGSLLAPQGGQAGPSSTSVEGPTSPVTPTVGQMTTRGVKRLASASIAAHVVSSNASGSESRKRRRHNVMYDTFRRVAKKRDATQKNSVNQRKPAAIHDTHGQYNKLPKLTPQEISRMKAEKDYKDMQELLARKRQEELTRQQRNGTATNMQQPQVHQQQQVNGVPRQSVNGLPNVQVPQIRSQVNISQQQRMPTPMAAGNVRMSPQQMAHAQAQAAQARAMAQAQAQAQNAASALNGAMGNSHLSPPYVTRTASSSPGIQQQASPPRNSVTPTNANNPPRPPSAQMVPVPGNAAPRPMSNMGHYFPVAPNMQGQFTQEQMEQAMQLRSLLQQNRQAGMSQGPQSGYQ